MPELSGAQLSGDWRFEQRSCNLHCSEGVLLVEFVWIENVASVFCELKKNQCTLILSLPLVSDCETLSSC